MPGLGDQGASNQGNPETAELLLSGLNWRKGHCAGWEGDAKES